VIYKRKHKTGSEKKTEIEKQKLLKCANDKSKKKLSFSTSVKPLKPMKGKNILFYFVI
jgi:hypothetical protein